MTVKMEYGMRNKQGKKSAMHNQLNEYFANPHKNCLFNIG